MNYLNPSEINREFGKSAGLKNAFPTAQLLVYSFLGGVFISMGCLLAIIVAGGMPGVAAANPGLVKFVFGAVFPLGLLLVVIGGAELFTSDCAIIFFGWLNGQFPLSRLVRLWTLGYLGNFAGALAVAVLFAWQSGILDAEPWLGFTLKIGEAKTSSSFLKVFIKGVGANWLVCMAVWMACSAGDITGKVLALWFPVMAFVALGFEHSIANMFFIPVAQLLGADITMYDFLIGNLLPATLGNIAGGAVFVALPYWFMFSKGRPAGEEAAGSQKINLNDITKFNKHLN